MLFDLDQTFSFLTAELYSVCQTQHTSKHLIFSKIPLKWDMLLSDVEIIFCLTEQLLTHGSVENGVQLVHKHKLSKILVSSN